MERASKGEIANTSRFYVTSCASRACHASPVSQRCLSIHTTLKNCDCALLSRLTNLNAIFLVRYVVVIGSAHVVVLDLVFLRKQIRFVRAFFYY